MAFTPETFVLCSKVNLFKAHANLWIYTTMDTLDDCLAEHYFQPRLNLKNQDSPEVGDVIQCIVEGSKLAYLKITGKTEKPYYITVARTFLENEAVIIAELAEMANKTTDFATPITDENLGITQSEQSQLEEKISLAANSGRMITAQGFWYAKMYSATVVPSAEDGTNYADFSQVDGEGNPIIVTYNRVSGSWAQDQTITPPADYDGYVPITSKIWDIAEQDGQQGGRILWNHTSKEFTPYPQIISFDSVELTGDSTVVMPVIPDNDNIANVGFVLDHVMARNVGDIFYTSRTDSVLNGAVPCDGTSYQTTSYSGAQAPGALLQAGKLPYVSLATYATLLATNGSVGVFGWDGIGTTEFKVPTLTDIFIETGTAAQVGDYVAPGAPNIKGTVSVQQGGSVGLFVARSGCITLKDKVANQKAGTTSTESYQTAEIDASVSSSLYGASNTIQPQAVRYRAMIQLSAGASDQSHAELATVAYTGDYVDLSNKPTIPTNVSQLTNDAGYIDSIKTINNNSLVGSGDVELSTYLPFGSWATTGTTKLFCDAIAADTSAVKGKAYLGEVTFSDLPSSMANGEVVVEIMAGTTAANKVIVLTLNSGNVAPYMWRYTYWNQGNNVSGWQTWATSAQGGKADTAVQPVDLATVATTGSYNDLLDKPTIPAAGVQYATYGTTTYQQIKDWHDAGELVVCKSQDGQQVLPLVSLVSTAARFGAAISGVSSYVYLYQVSNGNVWTNASELIQTQMQWSVMPIPSITYAGKIVQYVGETDANYTKGYFYTCVLNNTIYSWEQIDVQPNGSGGGHEVIAFQAPTAQNNYTWYRKYADGWVEQGGQHTLTANTYNTVNLAVTMADTNYFVSATYKDVAASDSSVRGINTGDYTTTSFQTKVGVNGANYVVVWEVKGMAQV